ncbi:MAG: cysteine-rich VLP domain-containing protein [Clostridiales bacterium]|nr:cysteine-rich VLP domain-containing protein [Clostridiales bacterium]
MIDKGNSNRIGLNYHQYRTMRRLVHECCNYDEGNCLLLEREDTCVCVQSISYSLCCKWFREAVLPLDAELEATLLHKGDRKACVICGAWFVPKSNRGKYCQTCAAHMKRQRAKERKHRQRERCHALESLKPL